MPFHNGHGKNCDELAGKGNLLPFYVNRKNEAGSFFAYCWLAVVFGFSCAFPASRSFQFINALKPSE